MYLQLALWLYRAGLVLRRVTILTILAFNRASQANSAWPSISPWVNDGKKQQVLSNRLSGLLAY